MLLLPGADQVENPVIGGVFPTQGLAVSAAPHVRSGEPSLIDSSRPLISFHPT